MGSTDLNHLCCLCLSTLNADEGKSVFDSQQVPLLSEKIFCVFGIQITNSKNWPSKLCTKCLENTEQSYNCRKKYKLLEHSLHDMLKKRPYSIPTSHETKKSFISYDHRMCDDIGGEVTKAKGSEKSVSRNDDTFHIRNSKYSTSNDDKNVTIKIKPNDYEKNIKNENYDQQDGFKVNNILTFPNIANHNEQSCITEVFKESGFRKQVVRDDTISTYEEELSNCTPTKTQSNYPSVIVRPAYQPPNIQGIVHVFKFPKKNFTKSKIHHADEMDDNQDQYSNDPKDRMSALLLAAEVLSKGKSTIEVPKKQDEKQAIIKRYSDHRVQQQVKNINEPSSIIKKYRPVKPSPVEKKCTNCGVKNSTAWRRLKNDLVCNACGLYYYLHGKRRPESMRRDTTLTRKRKIK